MYVQMLEEENATAVRTQSENEPCLEQLLDSVCLRAASGQDVEMRVMAHWLRRTAESIRQVGSKLDKALIEGNTDGAARAELLDVMTDLFQLGQLDGTGYAQEEEIPRQIGR